jgi:putative transcriptional regulator
MSRRRTIKAKKLEDGALVEILPSGETRAFPADQTDWEALRAMTDEEAYAAALADPDAQPLDEERLQHRKPVPRLKLIRIRLRLTQEKFAERYGIPLTTLRDWEQGRTEPDQTVQSYIRAINADPEGVAKALGKRREPQPA